MKTKLMLKSAAALLLLLTISSQFSTTHAQGTTAFTYQGRLNVGGSPANGLYDYRFKLYADPLGNTQVGSSYLTNAIGVTNGLFITTIDFGAGIFTGGTNWLEVDVRTNGAGSYTVLNPLQGVTPTPNAIFAETANNLSGTVASGSLSGTYGSAVTLNNAGNNLSGSFTGNGANVTNVNAAALNGLGAASFWQLGGNNVTGGQFLGSTNSQPLELRVNGARAGLISPGVNGPDIVFGGMQNVISNGTSASSILGGSNNAIQASSDYSVIAGGNLNTIQTFAGESLIGGGTLNTIHADTDHSLIGGGDLNTIQTNSSVATIGGGYQNCVSGTGGFIGGGGYDGSFIGGNTNYGNAAVIGGGVKNLIASGGADSVIGGGLENTIQINASYSMIGGGDLNTIQTNAYQSVIGGGDLNTIQAANDESTIGGGGGNTIQANANNSTIGGGYQNYASGVGSFIGGGGWDGVNSGGNTNAGNAAVIGGGGKNLIASGGNESVIGGGYQNTIQPYGYYCVLVGGQQNSIQTNADHSFLGGGYQNIIQAGAYASTISGGDNNVITNGAYFSTIGGGVNNVVGHAGSTVPGGNGNGAIGVNTFAAGTFAQAINDGSFVLSDQTYANFYSTAVNQFSARFGGGYRFFTGSSVLFTNGGAGQSVSWAPGSGSWSFTSDRATKDRFAAVDAQSVLQKVAQLPVSEWSYKGYDQRHIGAMAQDFHALFPLNENDRVLNDADLHGVELAAIKGLNQKVEEKDATIQQQSAEIADLKTRLEKLEQLVTRQIGGVK